MMFVFVVDLMIGGYDEYKSIWENPSADDDLLCEHKVGNTHDTHAVAVRKDIAGKITTVGHIIRKISLIRSIFTQDIQQLIR